ncbi:alpha/beta hydrolase [Luteolibacter sp. Populi]|uniref:alpha/beta hydrolase n=1 Tax=Luteolibacter sp. Populi TaxID=3230487 RepID=UPI0034665313
MNANPKIIFIHGMFQNPKSWDTWTSFFQNTGFDTEAPPWPLHEGEPADLRANIPSGLGTLSLADLHAHYRGLLSGYAEPPVVIGHSLGGLLAQKLLADGLVRAAVGIASVAPNRMLALDWGFMRNSASITNPFAGDDPYEMTPELFHRNFANTLSEAESNAAWRAYAVHESRQVLRDIMGDEGQIDLTRPHNPLLLIGAEKDEIIPSSLVRRNAHAYEDKRSHHEYKEFTGRGHFICGEPGWEEVAVSVSNWLEGHLSAIRA